MKKTKKAKNNVNSQMVLKKICWCLIILGALNWGLIGMGHLLGAGNWNLIENLLGNYRGTMDIIYVLIGASTVVVFKAQ